METKLDRIFIRDLLVRCIVGINDEERIKKQDIMINIDLYADLTKATESDNIEDTINYKKLKLNIIDFVENSAFFLIEKLAAEIAVLCLKEDKVQKVKVAVDKPTALRFVKTVGVEVIRTRD